MGNGSSYVGVLKHSRYPRERARLHECKRTVEKTGRRKAKKEIVRETPPDPPCPKCGGRDRKDVLQACPECYDP